MAGRDNGGIGSNGHGPGDGRVFDELDALSDEDLELLVGGAEDEEELATLREEAEAVESEGSPDEDAPAPDDNRPARRRAGDEERELVGRRLFPDWEYEPFPGGASEVEELEEAGLGAAGERGFDNGDGARTGIARVRQLLAPVEEALRAEGFYAYGTLDDENRWTVAVDDEAGRVDVRLAPDGFELDLRATSPGLYADVDHPFRRRRMERIVRETLPRIARGHLEPHQSTEWDAVDQGVAVCIRYLVPFARAGEIGRIVRRRLPELDDLLTLVEQRVTS